MNTLYDWSCPRLLVHWFDSDWNLIVLPIIQSFQNSLHLLEWLCEGTIPYQHCWSKCQQCQVSPQQRRQRHKHLQHWTHHSTFHRQLSLHVLPVMFVMLLPIGPHFGYIWSPYAHSSKTGEQEHNPTLLIPLWSQPPFSFDQVVQLYVLLLLSQLLLALPVSSKKHVNDLSNPLRWVVDSSIRKDNFLELISTIGTIVQPD